MIDFIKKLEKQSKRAAKAANKAVVVDLCNTIDIEKQKRQLTINDRIPDRLDLLKKLMNNI